MMQIPPSLPFPHPSIDPYWPLINMCSEQFRWGVGTNLQTIHFIPLGVFSKKAF